MTEKQKTVWKNVGKSALYTGLTFGAYMLAKGSLGLLVHWLATQKEKEKDSKKYESKEENE